MASTTIFDTIILTVTILTNLSLGTVIFLRNNRSASTRAFLGISVTVTAWAVDSYLTDHADTTSKALIFGHLSFPLGFLTVAALLIFAYNFSGQYRLSLGQKILALEILGGWAVISGTNLVMSGVRWNGSSFDLPTGPLYGGYLASLFMVFALAAIVFVQRYRHAKSEPAVRSQIRVIVIGAAVTFTLAVLTNAIIPAITGSWDISRFGPGLTMILVGSVGYAIVRHRLYDIRPIIARSAAYVLLITLLGLVYGSFVFNVLTEVFYQNVHVPISLRIVNTLAALLLAVTFQPLRRFFERATDRIFYRDRYDSQDVINAVGEILVAELDLDKLLHNALEAICTKVHIRHGQFFIFNNGNIYKVAHYGPLPRRIPVVPELRNLRQLTMVADDLPNGQVRRIMESHDIRLSRHLRAKNEFIGFMLLGDKLSGGIYSEQDLKLVETLSASLAIAIQNAKAYAEIAQFNLTLQDKIAQATKRLRTANTNLKSLDVAKDEFISMASHQLRTPLTTIKGYLSMILEGDTGSITDQQREFLTYSFDGSQRMVGLISDLLNVSRLAAGRFMIERAPTDLAVVAADEVRQLQTHADSKKIKLIFEAPKSPIPILQIDENKTRQVMMNFIDNAIYYTKEGEVRVSLEKTRTSVKLLVKDSGIGVPKDAQKKLFVKFYRADNAQIARPDGTGLGLFLAKRVVEDQGGKIIFSSVENKGSTFGFEMPIALPKGTKLSNAHLDQAPPRPAPPAIKKTIKVSAKS